MGDPQEKAADGGESHGRQGIAPHHPLPFELLGQDLVQEIVDRRGAMRAVIHEVFHVSLLPPPAAGADPTDPTDRTDRSDPTRPPEGLLDLVLVAAAADQQTDEEAYAGGDEHRAARIVAHVVGDVAGDLAGLLAHLGVALAGALGHFAIALAGLLGPTADLVRGPLGSAPHVFRHALVAVLDVLAHSLEAVTRRRDDTFRLLTRRFGTFGRLLLDCICHGFLLPGPGTALVNRGGRPGGRPEMRAHPLL